MSDERLDRWRDLMVAGLYDELPEAERAELEAELERNPTLAREWQELVAVRAALAETRGAEFEPGGLELLLPPRREEGGARRRVAMAAGAGFAAAASLFVVLLVGGLRVDATDGAVTVRFAPAGGEPAAFEPVHENDVPAAQPVTREEFERFADLLVRATSARLDDLERRQSANQVELIGTLYDALAVDQRRQYDDLRARLDAAIVRAAMVEPGGATRNRR